MNILPKKSWHVLSRDNIQRVRRDEAAAKAEDEEKQRRAEIAEREAQLDLMRRRAREREGISTESHSSLTPQSTSYTETSNEHINFFSDIQQGVGVQLSNKDHERESRSETESYEKKIGLLNYLVDKTKSDDPWYIRDRTKEANLKSASRKDLLDPINDMKHYLGTKRKHSEESSSSETRRLPVVDGRETTHKTPSIGETTRKKPSFADVRETTEKKPSVADVRKITHKKHKRGKEKSKEKATLEKLRKERLQREEAEMVKSEALLKKHYGLQESVPSTCHADTDPCESRPRKYNSQYNPSLARY